MTAPRNARVAPKASGAPKDPAREPAAAALPMWAALCFLASGAAGLLYEIVWAKQLAYVLGSSLHAVAAVVAAFLGGLALGARFLGVPLARRGDGARMYARLELGVAVLGLLLLPALRASDPLVGQLYRSLGGETPAFALARLFLLILALLPPAALMGATLPVLVAHVERDLVGAGLARLYALNTLGAVAGSLAAGFLLLPGLGLTGTTLVAAALNLAAAAVAWTRGGASAASPKAESGPAPVAPLDPVTRRFVAAMFALSGFAALAFQIAWVRLFGLVFGSSVYSFAAVLAVYLLGIALGSALAGPRLAGLATLAGFGALQLVLAASAALALQAFPGLPQRMLDMGLQAGADWRALLMAETATVALLIGVPCIVLGALFPVAARLLQSREGGHAAGTAYAVNTAGTIAGSLAAGFWLVPRLGVQGTHVGATVLAGLLGVGACVLAARRRELRGSLASVAGISLLVAGLLLAIAPRWEPLVMTAGVYRPVQAARVSAAAQGAPDAVRRASFEGRVLFYREGLNASVILGTDERGKELWLKVGGKVDASTLDMETQVLAGLLPGALADSGARTLVIGHGSGVSTASVLAAGAGPTEVVELEPGVVTASRWFHAKGEDPLDDPRTTLVLGDARTHLLHSSGRYGLIVSEPSNPWIAGVNNLFTVDFYRRVRARLEPDGVFCQWLQLYELSPGDVRHAVALVPRGVPRRAAVLRRPERGPAAGGGTRFTLDRPRAPSHTRCAPRTGPRAHQRCGDARPPTGRHRWTRCGRVAGDAPLNLDDRPMVEYRAPRDLIEVGRSAIRGHPGVIGQRAVLARDALGPAVRGLERGRMVRPARALAAGAGRHDTRQPYGRRRSRGGPRDRTLAGLAAGGGVAAHPRSRGVRRGRAPPEPRAEGRRTRSVRARRRRRSRDGCGVGAAVRTPARGRRPARGRGRHPDGAALAGHRRAR